MLRKGSPVFPLFALLAVSILSGVTVAATDPAGGDLRRSGPLDAKIQARDGGSIGVAPREIATLAPGDDLRVGWEKFVADHEGTWKVYLDERTALPTLVSGRGIEWFAKDTVKAMDLQQVEARVRNFLAENENLLGDWSAVLDFDVEASRELRPGHWQIVFRQLVDGVRVENSRFEFHVNQGRLLMFGMSHWGIPTTNGVPSIDEDQARTVLDAHLGVATALYEQAGKPELTLMALDPAPALDGPGHWNGARGEGLAHALIWRLRFRDPDTAQLWVGEVDAHDGSLLSFFDGTHYSTIRGGVFPISNDGDCAEGGCEIDGFPMPFSDMTEDGQPVDYTDAFGNMQCVVPTSPVTTALDGPYLRVSDRCGVISESGTCDEGIDLAMNPGGDCAVEDGASAGNTAAARSSFYHINRAAEVARFYDSANTWLRNPVTVNVNIASTCNAFWNGDINMYGSGNGCGNTGQQQGVLVHEWGHGYDENDGGGFDTTSEAYADVVSIFAARDSCISRGWYTDGRTCTGYGDTCLTCTGIRDHDWAAREFNAPTTPAFVNTYCPTGPGGPCGKESHCEAYPIGESIYDLVTRDLPASGMDPDSAWQLAERLWYETRPGSGGNIYLCLRGVGQSCATTSWYQRMRVADDDDGDLSNGTPHAAELHAAFGRHGIACGQASAPENQSTSSCPSLATPVLALTETGSGTELSWGAVAGTAEYRVYQSDLGCNRQQVPIASLTAGETSFVDTVAFPDLPRYYRIEAFGTNHACTSAVSNCEATPGGSRLQKNSHRIVETSPVPNGFLDPGETFTMPVTLFNGGLAGATGVGGQLRLVDPAQGTVTTPDATWAAIDVNAGLESDAPHFEVAVAETVSCGDLLTFDLDMLAASAATRTRRFQIQLGDPSRDFTNDVSQEIPPETTTPVTSTVVVDQDKLISDLDVSVNISHGITTELIVEVTSPAGTTVRLHDRTDPGGSGIRTRFDAERAPDGPGTMADFEGESTQGTWTLSVEDVGAVSTGTGTLQDWTLHAAVSDGFDCQPASCAEPPPAETADNLHVELSPNGPQLDLFFAWDPVATAAGYHVIQSTSPSFGASEVAGTTSGATTLTLDDGANTTPSLTFFKVRAVNSCGQEGP
jgi:subtilisin-like proprotein convertase family protein